MLTRKISKTYLKDPLSRPQLIHKEPTAGLINGLWANTLGMGGILSIESSFIYASNFLELKLTGMQGDVMKSMNVSKTVAWNLLTKARKLGAKMGKPSYRNPYSLSDETTNRWSFSWNGDYNDALQFTHRKK